MKNIKILRWNGLSLFYNISNGTYKGALATLVMLTLLTFIACGTPADADADADADTDGDGTADNIDNCPNDANPNQEDADDDKMGDECDNCPEIANPDQEDADDDKIGNECDNCQTIANAEQKDMDTDGYGDSCEVDDDGNGLIEIFDSEMLYNIRHNPVGTGYDDEADDTATAGEDAEGDKTGCGGSTDPEGNDITKCNGYELSNDITLTEDWHVITGTFLGTFDGKGFSISGLIISSGNKNVGFFANVSGLIRNIHLTGSTTVTSTSGNSNSTAGSLVGVLNSGGRVFSSSSTLSTTGNDGVGGLVGQNSGTIRDSYAIGDVKADGGSGDYVGGLVGWNDGTIRDSYAIGDATDADGFRDILGGLVGWNTGTIRNSYATGDATGGSGSNDNVGGLVGFNEEGTISNSYAIGDADGASGSGNFVGGLVGQNNQGGISNSYAIGNTKGGSGSNDDVGGLVGANTSGGTISNSYAIGSVNGGSGSDDNVGGLVGRQSSSTSLIPITSSYYNSNADIKGGTDSLLGTPVPLARLKAATEVALSATEIPTTETSCGAVGGTWDSTNVCLQVPYYNGWMTSNWVFEANKFPTLRSYIKNTGDVQEEGEILCGQNGDPDKDGVIDWVEGQCP